MQGWTTVRRSAWLTLGCAIAVYGLGCGKADYEKAMRDRVSGLAFESKFIEGLQPDPTEVLSRVADLRLPAFIDDRATTLTKTSKTRQQVPIDKRRIQPPGIDIPGFRYSYEKFIDMGGRNNTHPIYAYFGSVAGTQSRKSIEAAISRGAAKIKRSTWTDVSLDTPDRQKLAFRKLSVTGTQEFEMDPKGGDIQKKAGQLDIYVHSTPEHHIIVGFRGTSEAAEKVGMFDVAPFSLGTLVVQSSGEDADS